MDSERLEQKFEDGLANLKEKTKQTMLSLAEIQSQVNTLSTMEEQLKHRSNAQSKEELSGVDSFVRSFQTEVMGLLRSCSKNQPPSLVTTRDEGEGEELRGFKDQIAAMKASRDRLLLEIDRLSIELESAQIQQEQTLKENVEQRKLAAYWKQVSERNARQIDRLKDMLDETAEVCEDEQSTVAAIFAETSQRIDEDIQKDELMSKLLQSEEKNTQLRRTWLPTLRQLETRLLELNSAAVDAID